MKKGFSELHGIRDSLQRIRSPPLDLIHDLAMRILLKIYM